jgi:hypothetical protein
MDFVISLFRSRSNINAILIVTDKFTKFIKLIPDKIIYDIRNWVIVYYNYVYSQFSLFGIIISDRDSKFISFFWREFFKRTNTRLILTAVYYFQINDQNERTN